VSGAPSGGIGLARKLSASLDMRMANDMADAMGRLQAPVLA